MGLNKQVASRKIGTSSLRLKELHGSEMFVEKWGNSVFKATSGRAVSFVKFNRTTMY